LINLSDVTNFPDLVNFSDVTNCSSIFTTTTSQLEGRSEGGEKHRAKAFALLEGRPEDGRQRRKVGAKVERLLLQAGGQVGPELKFDYILLIFILFSLIFFNN
jgi:hypothetical protein